MPTSSFHDGGAVDLTVVVPFTRLWAVAPFFDALEASDVPIERSAIIAYCDTEDDAVLQAVSERCQSFRTRLLHFTAWEPPGEREKAHRRRIRHTAMRLGLRGLMPKTGRVLMLEDDTIVPADVYARLTRLLEAGADIAIGLQVGRWASPVNGVWSITPDTRNRGLLVARALDRTTGIQRVDAAGFYCMLCEAETYRQLDFRVWNDSLGHDVSVTYRATQAGMSIVLDWECGCGHLTPTGRIISPSDGMTGFRRSANVTAIMTPSGPFWTPNEIKKEEPKLRRGMYRTKQRIVVDGKIAVGKGMDITIEQAIEYVRRGVLSDPAINAYANGGQPIANVDETPTAPPVESGEIKLAQLETPVAPEPERGVTFVSETKDPLSCDVCGAGPFKSAAGVANHKRAAHKSETAA